MPNFLTQKSRGASGNQQVNISADASPTTFGDDLGVANEAYSVGDAPRNRVHQLGGEVYSVGLDGVYTKDDPAALTGPSTRVWQYGNGGGGAPDATNTNRKTGLHTITVLNVPHLVMAYGTNTGTSNWTGVKFNTDTTAWTEAPQDVALGASGTDVISEIVFDNKLYWITGPAVANGHRINVFDPVANTITQVNLNQGATTGFQDGTGNFSLGIMDGKLFVFGLDMNTGSERWHVAELVGSTLTRLVTVQAIAAVGAAAADGKPGFFTDNTYLYCFVWDDNPTAGWNAYRVTAGGAVTPINTVLPVALQKGSGPPTPTQARWAVTYDADSNPGTLDIYLWYAADGTEGTPQTLYKWVDGSPGSETEMTLVDAGGDVADAIPSTVTMTGGERIFTPGELDILITGRDPVLGGQKIRYKAWGEVGFANKNVEFRYNSQSEPTTALCTLTGVAVGGSSVRVGNQIQNVEADDGATEYEAIWDVTADGFVAGDKAQLTARISV
jgi:hypothetical protein